MKKKNHLTLLLSLSILATATTPAFDSKTTSVLVGSGIGAAVGALTMIYNMDLTPQHKPTIKEPTQSKIRAWLRKHSTTLQWASVMTAGAIAGSLSAYRLHDLFAAIAAAAASQGRPDLTDAHPLTRAQALDILELQPGATIDEMKTAYRKLARLHHPDKQADKSDEEKQNAEEVMRNLNRAKKHFDF